MIEKSEGAVIFRQENKVVKYLLLLHKEDHWDFVKGHVETGEEAVETVTRETEEETGIIDLKFLSGFNERISYSYERDGRFIKKEVGFLLAKTETESVNLSYEHFDYVWLSLSNAIEKATFQTSKQLLRKADKAVRAYLKAQE